MTNQLSNVGSLSNGNVTFFIKNFCFSAHYTWQTFQSGSTSVILQQGLLKTIFTKRSISYRYVKIQVIIGNHLHEIFYDIKRKTQVFKALEETQGPPGWGSGRPPGQLWTHLAHPGTLVRLQNLILRALVGPKSQSGRQIRSQTWFFLSKRVKFQREKKAPIHFSKNSKATFAQTFFRVTDVWF